jgi:cobyrinic acid a,c-diamide synthase
VRYHHVGPLAPAAAWDRWEGAVFVDPALTSEDTLLGLYGTAARHADVSLLSSSAGLLDKGPGADWEPRDMAGILDCPVVVVTDCRGWGQSIRLVATGIKAHLPSGSLAGVVLSGVSDREHRDLLREVFADEGIPVAGCLLEGQGLEWDSNAPGAWGLPLSTDLLDTVARQVDVGALLALAGQRGFLAASNHLAERESEGPSILVASGEGFTPWSRDSIEVLKAAGARVRRLDLLKDVPLPAEAAGLILAGTLWPETIQDIAMNTVLLRDIAAKVRGGLPTLALGGGMLLLLSRLQDTLGRTSELADVVPARGEVLWDLDEPSYVEVKATRDNLLFEKGDRLLGWVFTEFELSGDGQAWEAPLVLTGVGTPNERREAYGTGSLLCSPAMVHLAGTRHAAGRFVESCRRFAQNDQQDTQGRREPGP